MTFNSSFAVLLAMLALGAALVTHAAGRPWESWPATTPIQNPRGGGEGYEEEGVAIPPFLLNYRSPLDSAATRQYAALWENRTLGQHIEAFCRNANLMCDPDIMAIDDDDDHPRSTDISREDNDELNNYDAQFNDGSEPLHVDGQLALQLGERGFLEGEEIVVPESLGVRGGLSNRSPAFLPDFLAEKMPLSSEKIQELLDTFHISHDSKLANIMFRTINHCEAVKEKASKEIEVTKEKEVKEKEVVVGKERGFEGEEIEHKRKERKVEEIEFSKEKDVKAKKSKVVEEQEKKREFVLNKEKEIEQSSKQSITKEIKKKSTKKGKKKEVKKETVQSKEKKTEEKQVKEKEVVKETMGKEIKRKEVEKHNEKDIKEKKFRKNVYETTKENSSEEKKVKDKEIKYKKKEKEVKDVKEKEMETKEKERKEKNIHKSKEKDFHVREEKVSEDKKIKGKEIEHKKEMGLKKKDIHGSEEKSKEEKMVNKKEIMYRKEKESKEKDFHLTGEKVVEDKKKEVKKKETKKLREEKIFQDKETKYYKEKEVKDKEKEIGTSKEMELKRKDVHGGKEKSKLLKENDIDSEKEMVMKEKKTYLKKDSSKEISKCVTSLEGMTSFVKKSLPKEKYIKALERSTFAKHEEKEPKKIKWKVLALKKYEKAVVCKSNLFLFAVYKCHDISKIGSKFIYHIELEGIDGVHRKEILACEGKKQSMDSKNRKFKKLTSTMKISCQWIKPDSLIWVPDI